MDTYLWGVRMKECIKCHKVKPSDEFHNRKDSKDGKRSYCKECQSKYNAKHYQEHREEQLKKTKIYNQEHRDERRIQKKNYWDNGGGKEKYKEWYEGGGRELGGYQSMHENKNCAAYLGIVIAERLIKHLFNDVIMMTYGFPGYDIICNKGKRINVKASSTRVRQLKNSTINHWKFDINYNKDCDYFLCLAFDNVEELNILFGFIIPGNEVNHLSGIQISTTTIHKWDQWKMDLNNVQACCDLMRGGKKC